ncbi:MAG: M28 family peptidase [Bacteroidales bacterium]|nr:M28 family peptidase [Bacteroidales bacterium]
MRLYSIIFLATILFSLSCHRKEQKTTEADKEKVEEINVPEFDQDSAYNYISQQLSYGARVPNTEAHRKCADYLWTKMNKYADTVIIQKTQVRAYNNTLLQIKNIISSFNPDSKTRIMLCTHWDSRPFADKDPDKSNHTKAVPAANDGASGVAVLMEIARNLKNSPLKIGIDLIFLDAEDYGTYNKDDSWGLGSQYWAKNPHIYGYSARYGILLDMVGAAEATFYMEEYSMTYAPDVVRKIWNMAEILGYSDYFINRQIGPITDDHYFINKYSKTPTIDIIHYDYSEHNGFFKYWHTLKDDINAIDKKTLKAVGQTLLEVIYREQ